ncbi:MAG: GDP-mannose 4,6-dehydratase [Thermodesulfobacteriota bacterium]|nr:GDP-mannose 4,6-dehydratase [Thermodesulfobacteriota bacterium]
MERLTPGNTVISVDPAYFRPAEVFSLIGETAKAEAELGWQANLSLREGLHQAYQWCLDNQVF